MYSIRDCIFVDQARLDSYFQQIEKGPIADKVPYWEYEISVTNLSASRKQDVQQREPTVHEKIAKFLHYIKKEEILSTSYCTPSRVYFENMFRLENGVATQIIIPPKVVENIQISAIKIWIFEEKRAKFAEELRANSDNDTAIVRLLLVEDRRSSDHGQADLISNFSALSMVTGFLEKDLRESQLDLEKLYSYREIDFAKNPVELLKKVGARILGSRNITAIYKTRVCSYGPEDLNPPYLILFGYPIVVFEGNISL